MLANSYFKETGDLLKADISVLELSEAVMPRMGTNTIFVAREDFKYKYNSIQI